MNCKDCGQPIARYFFVNAYATIHTATQNNGCEETE